MEDHRSQQIEVEDEHERVVALQAIETYRALRQAMKTAPHGKGLATLEAMVHDKGFDHLKRMLQPATCEHPEAQKRGLYRGLYGELLVLEEGQLPWCDSQAVLDGGWSDAGGSALLRLPVLWEQADAAGCLGWREMWLSVVARREAASPVQPSDWNDHLLPEPTAKLAICAMADCRRVGSSWQRLTRRVGLHACDHLSVIADGAKWIWHQARVRLSQCAEWCVDIFHISQHLHECGKALAGEGAAAQAWAERHLNHLLEHAGVGLIRDFNGNGNRKTNPAHLKALDRLLCYLNDNRDHLWYPDRLASGLPISSGLIEGCCKNAIGQRLKLNSARWRIRPAQRMGVLRCLEYRGQTNAYWQLRTA